MKCMFVFGTRPEAIKCAPVIFALREAGYDVKVCSTGQQKQMLDQVLDVFSIKPDYDLDIMKTSQTLEHITSRVVEGLAEVLTQSSPDIVFVQGDTTTAFAGALTAFYQKIPVAHIEAGLRTNNKYNPFPEEINRRLISQIADLHFAPTIRAKGSLMKDGISESTTYVTGNTVVDALNWVAKQRISPQNSALNSLVDGRRFVLVTSHRRENIGTDMEAIFDAIAQLARENADISFIFPVHLNPVIQDLAHKKFHELSNVILTEPLNYTDMVLALKNCLFVMTDSGGLQEEAPTFGKPVLVLRKTTERPEGIESGVALLVGTKQEDIYEAASQLLHDTLVYEAMSRATNPYGDGTASKKIVQIILENI